MAAPENYYELLGIEATASTTTEEIRAAYRSVLKVTAAVTANRQLLISLSWVWILSLKLLKSAFPP